MNLTDKIRGLFKKEERIAPTGALYDHISFFLNDYSNKNKSEAEILKAFHENPIFFSSISLISNSIASQDFYFTKKGIKAYHKLDKKFDKPNIYHSRYSFMWLVSAYLLSLGRVYIYVLQDKSMIPVSPTHVVEDKHGHYTVTIGSKQFKATRGVDIVSITLPDLRQPYTSGTSYGSSLSQELDISESASTHEAAYLQNNARPDLLINYHGVSSDQLKTIDQSWKSKHQGASKSGKPSLTNAEKITVKELTSSFKDLGLIELRKYSSEVIRQTFGIPPELLGDIQNANRATIESAEYLFLKNTIDPKLRHILIEFETKLLPILTQEKDLGLDYDSIIPEDREFQFKIMSSFPDAFTRNDIRKLAGKREIEGGEISLSGAGPVKEKEEETSQRLFMRSMGSKREELHFVLSDILQEPTGT